MRNLRLRLGSRLRSRSPSQLRFRFAAGLALLLSAWLLPASGVRAAGPLPSAPIDPENPTSATDPRDSTESIDSFDSTYAVDDSTAQGDSASKPIGATGSSPDSAAKPSGASAPTPPDTTGGEDQALELSDKEVKARGSRAHRQKEVSRIRLTRRDLQRVVAAQGDPLKVLSTLPGVNNQNDLSVRPFVRGGKAEETQILWDGVTLIQPYHFGTLYSIFNTESLESMTLYSGGFPAEAGNALSAALFMQSRPAPLDSLHLFADLSMLRGNFYAGVPIVKNKLGVSFSYQAFWYDWVLNRGWDLVDLIQNDSNVSAQKQEFQKYVSLPNFRDVQLGLNWSIRDNLHADYTAIISNDGFAAREGVNEYFHNGREVSSDYYNQNATLPDGRLRSGWSRQQGLDTVANVAVDNAIHGLHFHWRPSEALEVDQSVAYQRQDWHVKFSDDATWHDSVDANGNYAGYKTYGPSVRYLNQDKEAYDWNIDARWQAHENHLIKLGASQSMRQAHFDTRLERTIYEIIVNGSVDASDGLGYFDPKGFTILQNDPGSAAGVDYLGELPKLVRFDYQGRNSGTFSGAYISDAWQLDDRHRLTLGVRGELDTYSGDMSLSPRGAYFQSLGDKDEITVASGLYSQADFPFQLRFINPKLTPEKAFHVNLEWTHAFSPHYRMETQFYQKNYYDLAVATLVNTGRINWSDPILRGLDSTQFDQLDPAARKLLLDRFGEKKLDYRNTGLGKAGGTEVSFFYDPIPVWSGWLSMEAGYSKRIDHTGEREYDFRYSRPWALNWVNYFHMPSRYELSLRGRFAAGQPYTDYRVPGLPGSDAGTDTLFYLGPRNGARYAPYSRWDLRLSKETKVFGHALSSYMEIWNAFNSPNFIMRDEKTQNWKFIDGNFPIPILFLGLSYRL